MLSLKKRKDIVVRPHEFHGHTKKDLIALTAPDISMFMPEEIRIVDGKPRRGPMCGTAGCSKASLDKAAASEMPRRTFQYVEALSDARTRSAALFNILLRAFEAGDFRKHNRGERKSQPQN